MKFSHKVLTIIAGLKWLGIGIFLLTIGLKFIVQVSKGAESGIIIQKLAKLVGGKESAGALWAGLSLLLGYLKNRFFLVKTIGRVVDRIKKLPNPSPLTKMYRLGYYFIIAGMIGLGALMKYFNVPLDLRGGIDVAVGSALVNGALNYFRKSAQLTDQSSVV